MRYVRMDPPGTWCLYSALELMLRGVAGGRFLEVGVGSGEMSRWMLERGFEGEGLDFSERAVSIAGNTLANYIDSGKYRLRKADLMDDPDTGSDFDIVMSFFVIEHVEDEKRFMDMLRARLKPGGMLIISVPGRMDCWSVEDDTVGHLKRYEREGLEELLAGTGFVDIDAWSVSVPVSNLLLGMSNLAISRSGEEKKKDDPMTEQTQESGIRDVPFKTVFPPVFKLVLNRYAMWPFMASQRLFFKSNMGLTVLARAKKPV
ncbi:MAG TPA: class I SAM-dependent methyltransferase [bacterium]|nr:class I SAM-dependent methyltransferase [bacterium]